MQVNLSNRPYRIIQGVSFYATNCFEKDNTILSYIMKGTIYPYKTFYCNFCLDMLTPLIKQGELVCLICTCATSIEIRKIYIINTAILPWNCILHWVELHDAKQYN